MRLALLATHAFNGFRMFAASVVCFAPALGIAVDLEDDDNDDDDEDAVASAGAPPYVALVCMNFAIEHMDISDLNLLSSSMPRECLARRWYQRPRSSSFILMCLAHRSGGVRFALESGS